MTPKHLLRPARLAGSSLLGTQSDERLVDLVRSGSEPAFDALVRRYRRPLLRYCGGLLGAARAEDAVQSTFVSAYHALRRDDREVALKPWLYRIARNTALNVLRDPALGHRELDPERAAGEGPHEAVERRQELAAVLAAVQSLPQRQRDAIILRELEGRSYPEIASALGADGGAVRALLNRARNSLRYAASAVMPVGAMARTSPGSGRGGEDLIGRVAELTAGATAGAAVGGKLAATALVTGALAGGVALAPPIEEPPGGRQDVGRAGPAGMLGGGVARAQTRAADAAGADSTLEPSDGWSGGDGSRPAERSDREAGRRDGEREREHPGTGSGESEDDEPDEEREGDESDRSGPGGRDAAADDDDDAEPDHDESDSDNSGSGSSDLDHDDVDDDSSGPGSDGSGGSGSGGGDFSADAAGPDDEDERDDHDD